MAKRRAPQPGSPSRGLKTPRAIRSPRSSKWSPGSSKWSPGSSDPGSPRQWFFIALLVVVGVWSYSTSFRGAFVGDDVAAIVENPHIRSLWPPSVPLTSPKETTLAGRPVTSLTFALNYALTPPGVREVMAPDPRGRSDDPFYDNVWGYHAVNLLVHLLAGSALFGVVRRTLRAPALRERFARASAPLAFAIAAIWLTHPLQTSSVTFIAQRAESLMGVFFLATVYCSIRAAESGFQNRNWTMAAIGACALGMATKEVMVTAPILVALWIWIMRPDVTLTGPPRRLLIGLAATWIIFLGIATSGARTSFIGFHVEGWTWWTYLEAQSAVIVRYGRLAFWPQGLVFNYVWFPPHSFREVAPQFAVIGVLAAATAVALIKRKPIGWMGAWFFLILAPTSSFLPISTEVAAEFRMYLPLAAIVSLIVLGAFAGFDWIARRAAVGRTRLETWSMAGWVAVAAVTLALGVTTRARSRAYDSVDSITADIVQNQPEHAEARLTHGTHLIRLGRFAEAEENLRTALALPLPPDVDEPKSHALMHMYLGVALNSQGKTADGIAELERAIAIKPELDLAYGLLADAQLGQRRPREALASLERVIAQRPDTPQMLSQAAWILATSSDASVRNGPRAIEYAERAVRLGQGGDIASIDTLAASYAEAGQFDKAVANVRSAIDLDSRQGGSQFTQMLQAHLTMFQGGRPIRTAAW